LRFRPAACAGNFAISSASVAAATVDASANAPTVGFVFIFFMVSSFLVQAACARVRCSKFVSRTDFQIQRLPGATMLTSLFPFCSRACRRSILQLDAFGQ
jgi:hypothetical protein